MERVPFDLREAVEAAAGLMAPGAHAKGVELICHVEPEVPTRVFGIPARLRQVLLNLTGNAVKFTGEGHIALLVSAGRRDSGSRALIGFSVVDTGVGFQPMRWTICSRHLPRPTAPPHGASVEPALVWRSPGGS